MHSVFVITVMLVSYSRIFLLFMWIFSNGKCGYIFRTFKTIQYIAIESLFALARAADTAAMKVNICKTVSTIIIALRTIHSILSANGKDFEVWSSFEWLKMKLFGQTPLNFKMLIELFAFYFVNFAIFTISFLSLFHIIVIMCGEHMANNSNI